MPLVFVDGLWLMVGGYLRPPPDRATESRLRAAFADLDRDLAAILGDLTRQERETAAPNRATATYTAKGLEFRPI